MKQFTAILTILLLPCCFTPSKISNQNLSYLYWKESNMLHPEFTVFHISDSISRLYCAINSKELLYSKESDTSEFTAVYVISYNLYPSFESIEILDSASAKFNSTDHRIPVQSGEDRSSGKAGKKDKSLAASIHRGKRIIQHIDFKAALQKTYLLEARVLDVKRNQTSTVFINVDKRSIYSRQNFIVESKKNGSPIFRNYLKSYNTFTIRSNDNDISKLFMSYYSQDFNIAHPPFSVQDQNSLRLKPDSTFSIQLRGSTKTALKLQKRGIYHFQTDSIIRDGLTLFKYYDDFPKVTSPEHLIEPLCYITTKQEYQELILHKNKKLAVDDFWLKITGNPDRGKKIIHEFYNRIQDANKYFSSYLEGWKTDRGMIYIIYGLPDVVYKTSSYENWVYGEEGNQMSLNFTFTKVRNPLTDNDYSLNRSLIYKNSWYMAVDAWRQGIIY
ncbi:MAG: GWxTD domain-containing protein [Bacteroidota bacterium]